MVCCVVFGAIMLFTFPDTVGKPLEEVARLFGDDDLVALYSEDVPVHEFGETAAAKDEKRLLPNETEWLKRSADESQQGAIRSVSMA